MRKPVRIKKEVLDQIVDHVKKKYPNECCGVLVGKDYKDKFIEEAYEVTNINKERSEDRYLMDPKELQKIDHLLRIRKLEILGFYHSHPDHPNRPSEFDRERAAEIEAHETYSYMVISCEKGIKVAPRCWILSRESNQFKEEEIKIMEEVKK